MLKAQVEQVLGEGMRLGQDARGERSRSHAAERARRRQQPRPASSLPPSTKWSASGSSRRSQEEHQAALQKKEQEARRRIDDLEADAPGHSGREPAAGDADRRGAGRPPEARRRARGRPCRERTRARDSGRAVGPYCAGAGRAARRASDQRGSDASPRAARSRRPPRARGHSRAAGRPRVARRPGASPAGRYGWIGQYPGRTRDDRGRAARGGSRGVAGASGHPVAGRKVRPHAGAAATARCPRNQEESSNVHSRRTRRTRHRAPELRSPAGIHVPEITGVRLKPHGADATLVNISTSGILVECASRIKPGTAVIVVFEGTFSPAQIDARVARSSVAIMHKGGGLGYHTGIAFNQPIVLPDLPRRDQRARTSPSRRPRCPRPSIVAAAVDGRGPRRRPRQPLVARLAHRGLHRRQA